MMNLFRKNKKELDAVRIHNIYKNINIKERINHIVDSEYKRMIFLAERTALNGETSFAFDLEIEKRDEIYFNVILSNFITKVTDNGFRYSRQMLSNKNRIMIYFSLLNDL